MVNGISRTLLSAKKKNVEDHRSSDQVSVLARKVLRKISESCCPDRCIIMSRQTKFPYSLRRTLLSAKKKNVESSSRSILFASDQVSVLARKVLRKFPNPAVCKKKKKVFS
jgi:hypothetical protein